MFSHHGFSEQSYTAIIKVTHILLRNKIPVGPIVKMCWILVLIYRTGPGFDLFCVCSTLGRSPVSGGSLFQALKQRKHIPALAAQFLLLFLKNLFALIQLRADSYYWLVTPSAKVSPPHISDYPLTI